MSSMKQYTSVIYVQVLLSQKPFGLESYSDSMAVLRALSCPIPSQKPFGLESYSDACLIDADLTGAIKSQKPFGLESYSDHATM